MGATTVKRYILGRLLLVATSLVGWAPASSLGAARSAVLFNGEDLVGWRSPSGDWMAAKAVSLDPANPERFVIAPGKGVLVNGTKGRTLDLMTESEYGDLKVHVEFCIPRRSNSGIYLMGRYEIQVYDSFGVKKDQYPGIECGGIYPRWINGQNVEGHSPRVNASKPAGRWQTFDIVFRAPRFDASGKKTANAKIVQVIHNRKVVHRNVELTGPTRSAKWDDEKATGPLLLQGDHGPVAYRNLSVHRIELKDDEGSKTASTSSGGVQAVPRIPRSFSLLEVLRD